MPIKITHLLIFAVVTATLAYLFPASRLLVMIGLLIYVLKLAADDLTAPFRQQAIVPKSESDFYQQFESKQNTALLLSLIAFGLFLTGWVLGAFVDPSKTPISINLVADIVFTVVGMAVCFYARMNANNYFQTVVTWIPLCCWLAHAVILLGHGIEIERMTVE